MKNETVDFTVKCEAVLTDELQKEDLDNYMLHTYEMIYSEGTPILISSKASPELRRRVKAAAVSYLLRAKSIDHILKTLKRK